MKNNKNLGTWLNEMSLTHPLVIAGPCSAESEEQVLKIAHQLKIQMPLYYAQEYGNPEPDQEILRVLVKLV